MFVVLFCVNPQCNKARMDTGRQEFLRQIAERARETNQRLRNQPLTCVSIIKPAVQQASMPPTEAELLRVRAALRQTMMPLTSEEEAHSMRPRSSHPPDHEEHGMRASSAWSVGSAQQPTQHWVCQNVLLPIPGTPGSVRSTPLTSGPAQTTELSVPLSSSAVSPMLSLCPSGAKLADDWIRSPAGEDFMTAMVASELKKDVAHETVAHDEVLNASTHPAQPIATSVAPGSEAARQSASFSFVVPPSPGVAGNMSPRAIGIVEGNMESSAIAPPATSSPASPTEAKGARPSGPSSAIAQSVSCQLLATAATGPVQQAATHHPGDVPVAEELALAQADVQDLRRIISVVQQLLPETDAPQALSDVDAFVVAVRKCMSAPPAEAIMMPAAAHCGATPGSVSLLKGLEGRGLGIGKGLFPLGRRSSSAPSGAITPMAASSGVQSATRTTATGLSSTASICTTPTEVSTLMCRFPLAMSWVVYWRLQRSAI